jgi:hypothetical protein
MFQPKTSTIARPPLLVQRRAPVPDSCQREQNEAWPALFGINNRVSIIVNAAADTTSSTESDVTWPETLQVLVFGLVWPADSPVYTHCPNALGIPLMHHIHHGHCVLQPLQQRETELTVTVPGPAARNTLSVMHSSHTCNSRSCSAACYSH